MDEVERLCDRVVLLEAGQVIAEGTPAELAAQANVATLEEAFVTLTGRQVADNVEEEDE